MSPNRLPLLFSLSLLLTVLCLPAIARADDTEGDDYDVKARVVRISLIHGDVSFKRHETEDWETARLNTPLVEGDTISTGNNGRAEIQIDARNFLRLSSDSVLRIVTLRDEGIALSLAEGTATLRLARFDREKEYFEIDAPKTTIAAERTGVYRITAGSKGNIQLTVRDGGRARIYSDTAGFTVKEGHSATLTYEGDEAGDWQTASAGSKDSWDEWVTDRESYLATRLKYEQNMRYYDSDIWGAEDLDAYGSWAYANDYGWIWRPNITIINNYNDWAPYRFGSWTWCPPYGWTWVGDEPWGWAPYHYGRWVYYNNYWAWCPHSYYRSHRSWWRPALVAFLSIDFNFGSNYCWYPLSYHHRDPRSNYFHHDRERLRPLRGNELASLRRINPAYLRALNTLPARDFGNGRGRAASGDIARRVIDAQPLRGDLPIRPTVGAGNNRGDNRIARPASTATLRPTGATTRTPGVPLDNELRRSRVFNGREPVGTPIANTGRTPETRPTGAVARPVRSADPPINRNLDVKRNPDGSNNAPTAERPVRPRSPDDSSGREGTGPSGPGKEETERPASSGNGDTPARPVRPREERPVVDHNPTPREERERPAKSNPPARPERVDRPHDESPAPPSSPPRSESPRPDPPQRSEPPQRHESPPQRSEPPQRHESPPQRSEPAPQRHESPPQRSEPARPSKPAEEKPTRLDRKSSGS